MPERPSMKELRLAAECLRLKAALYDCGVKITSLEERNRALTAALHRANS